MNQKKISVKPFENRPGSKKEQVRQMFDEISPRYDFLNHLLSANFDKLWRRKVVEILKSHQPERVLDVATGTGDLAVLTAKKLPDAQITGLDLSPKMLEVAKKKIKNTELEHRIKFIEGDAENLPFEEAHFEAATVAFGVRNFQDLDKGLKEISRVLKPGGVLVVLEFSNPEKFPFKQLYGFYSKKILPLLGSLISGNKDAYTYLPRSVEVFPYGKDFEERLEKAGLQPLQTHRLMFGIASIYTAQKK